MNIIFLVSVLFFSSITPVKYCDYEKSEYHEIGATPLKDVSDQELLETSLSGDEVSNAMIWMTEVIKRMPLYANKIIPTLWKKS